MLLAFEGLNNCYVDPPWFVFESGSMNFVENLDIEATSK